MENDILCCYKINFQKQHTYVGKKKINIDNKNCLLSTSTKYLNFKL